MFVGKASFGPLREDNNSCVTFKHIEFVFDLVLKIGILQCLFVFVFIYKSPPTASVACGQEIYQEKNPDLSNERKRRADVGGSR